jgi:hypothetical protein
VKKNNDPIENFITLGIKSRRSFDEMKGLYCPIPVNGKGPTNEILLQASQHLLTYLPGYCYEQKFSSKLA